MTGKRIHLISGPRNISTALMYSFGNRSDTGIVDEPLYAYYLNKYPEIIHPGREDILKSQSINFDQVLKDVFFREYQTQNVFIKNMAHHLIDTDWTFLEHFTQVFLIRNPAQLISSFAQVIPNPTMQDIGLKLEYKLFNHCLSLGQQPIVLDSNEVLKNPELVLSELCAQIDIPFDASMLKWDAGPRVEDGVWAKFWYANVHKSMGFKKPSTSDRIFPERLKPLLTEAQKYYNLLCPFSIKAE